MKKKLFLALLALVGLSAVSCQKVDNSPPVPEYLAAIEFVDQNGQNILVEISQVNAYCEAWDQEKNTILRSGARITKSLIEDVPYLAFGIAYGSAENCPKGIIWKIKCKEIFSDEKLYDVKSSWEAHNLYDRKCTSFEFAGKSYTPELKNGVWTARVVVNR